MLRLIIQCDDRSPWTFPLTSAEATLGSLRDNDIIMTCKGVSRHHAKVTRGNDSIVIQDLDSKNGMYVSGRRVEHVKLSPGDQISIGHASVRLERIDTSDVERAIDMDDRSSAGAPDRVGETDSRDIVAHGSGQAWEWARDAEHAGDSAGGSRRPELLRRARAITGADAILRCHLLGSGELALDEVDGSLPASEEQDQLSDLLHGAGAAVPQRSIVKGRWAAIPLADGAFVCVHSADAQFSRSAWCLEFLEFVVSKIFSGTIPDEAEVFVEEEHDLVFPKGYVRGDSPVMRALYEQVRGAVRSEANILLRGENGTGKEPLAKIIHLSSRPRLPFLAKNCSAIPADLLEAELFGVHGRVATGVDPRKGLFVSAGRGTLFLDEIGDLPLKLQPKLLRVLQEREVQPLGKSAPEEMNARVIAATNRPLEEMMEDGTFRRDLYYRLRGLELTIPPLRERRADIPQFVTAFVTRLATQYRKRIRGVSTKALAQLMAYNWPGNIRELEIVLEQAISTCPSGGTLESSHLGPLSTSRPAVPSSTTLHSRIAATERQTILDALRNAHGNKSKAARILDISRQALYEKLGRFKIQD